MEKIEAVRRMQIYIAQNLAEEIKMGDLAKASYFSPWYSYRLFQEYLKITPANYIRRLRLSKSALELRDAKTRITDVAFKYGYESVDGYQRAFLKEFKMNPNEYLKNPTPICLFIPYLVMNKGEKKNMEKTSNVFLTVIEKPARKVIIKRGIKANEYMSYCNEVGCDVWGILKSMPSLSGEPVCLWLPQKYVKPNTSTYVMGVEVPMDYKGEIPDGFEIMELPKAKYLMFQGEPFKEEDFENAIYSVWNAIKKYDPSTIGYKYDEDNPRIQLEPIGTRGYIELLAIK